MAGFIAKQPNGLYCRFSSVVDCPTDWNMTAEDYIELCAERAREEARNVLENHLKPFEWVEECFVPNIMSEDKFAQFLKDVRLIDFDIHNNKERLIRCVDNDDSNCFGLKGAGHLLTVGQDYTLTDVEVHGWHTRVSLAEFPGVEFNSVLFEDYVEDDK